MSPAARWRVVAFLGVCATLIAGTVAPQSRVAAQLAYFLILFVLIIPVHELGHAVAGALVGFRIMSVVVGSGPPLGAFRGLGVSFQINLLPLGGMTLGFARKATRWVRLRQWIFTAGGPAANVLIYVVLKRLFGPATSDADQHPIVATAVAVNWSILVANLIPFRMPEGMRSDGYGLFTIPFWSRKQVEEALVVHAGVRAQDALNRNDLPAARQFAEEARRRFPDSPMPDTLLGAVQHRQRQHDEALATWRAALLKTTDPKQEALLKNNIAFAALVRGHTEDLPEADRLSGEAITVLPELAPVAGTRGAVLLRLGRAAEALPLLALGEAGAMGGRNQAYTKALMASTLAALGRGEEARRKLAEARLAEPDCELLPRAQADIAAGPLAAPPAAARVGASPPDAGTRTMMLRQWRRDARILAFVTGFVVLERLGFQIAPVVIVIVMSIAPEPSGVVALGAYGLSAAVMFALGLAPAELFGTPSPSGAAPLALAAGVAACWLVARHRRLGPQPPTRTPIVLGWILAGMAILSFCPDLIRLSWERSPLSLHGRAREHLGQIPGLIALGALLASRRHRAARPLAVLPVAAAVLALVGGSTFYLNRFVLADVAAHGPALTWAAAIPAKVARNVNFSGRGNGPAVSPGGRAFFVKDIARPAASDGGTPRLRYVLRVGDFDGHLVEVAGTAGVFVDEQRLLVLRPGAGARGANQLAEVRPFQGPQPVWTKDLADTNIGVHDATLSVDRDTGTIFIQGDVENDSPILFRTTIGADTPVVAHPLHHRERDKALAIPLSAEGWGGFLVARTSGAASTLWWRDRDEEHRLAAGLSSLDCIAPPPAPGTPQLWCLTSGVPILLRIDATAPRLERIPGEIPPHWQPTMLGPSVIAMLSSNELDVLDLNERRGIRLTLPESNGYQDRELARGALATLTRTGRGPEGTFTVYEWPAAASADAQASGK